MRKVELANGVTVPAIGLGTWYMGERQSERAAEVAVLRAGIEAGATLIDTAEMYASGGAEEVVGEAVRGRRDEVFLVSKVLPSNASRQGTRRALEASLRRLGTEYLDLYLLHWRGAVPFKETLEVLQALQVEGKIRGYGVSNLDLRAMKEWSALDRQGGTLTDQVQYSIDERGIDFDLVPWCREQGIAIMAYCPLSQGRLPERPGLAEVAKRHGATAAQIMLAWVTRHPHVIAIPKSASVARTEENVAAGDIVLTVEDLAILDRDFPPPAHAKPLAMT